MRQTFEEPKELAYDLRQGLAKRLNEILDLIAEAAINRKYKDWFELLDILFIEVSKKLNEKEEKEYNKLVDEANKIIGENPKAYAENKGDGSRIYSKLKQIDIWLQRKMEKKKMFGFKDQDEGL